MVTKEKIYQILATVTDPEIPVLTLEDLGVIREVIVEGEEIEVKITPTYTGCPATDVMAQDIVKALAEHGFENVKITRVLHPPWTSAMISEEGLRKLKEYGIAPPVKPDSKYALLADTVIACPRCHSTDTEVVSEFGSTACKALLRCNQCLEPFEYFKCTQ